MDTMEEAGDMVGMVTTRPIMSTFTLHCPSPEKEFNIMA